MLLIDDELTIHDTEYFHRSYGALTVGSRLTLSVGVSDRNLFTTRPLCLVTELTCLAQSAISVEEELVLLATIARHSAAARTGKDESRNIGVNACDLPHQAIFVAKANVPEVFPQYHTGL